jgi:ribosomal protein S18 acetylase RimI-like enzyme
MPPESLEIRLLTPADLAVLERALPDVFDYPINRTLAEEFLAAPDNMLAVAVQAGTVVGMASGIVYVHPDKPRQLFINEVGVAEGVRRQGIGQRLVQALLAEARKRGCTEAWVATEEHNEPARALYESLQGKEDPDRAIVYTWQLSGKLSGGPM